MERRAEEQLVSKRASRVGRACVRCQGHRIKCDNQRPCSQCVRRNVECDDQVSQGGGYLAMILHLVLTPCTVVLVAQGATNFVHGLPDRTRQVRQGTAVLALSEASAWRLLQRVDPARVQS